MVMLVVGSRDSYRGTTTSMFHCTSEKDNISAMTGNYNRILSYWDDYDTGNGRYYTNDQMRRRTNGESVTFHDGADRPHSDTEWFFRASLFLFNSQNQVILFFVQVYLMLHSG